MPIDRWFDTRRVPMSWEAFVALPRHPAYKVEHLDGVTWLTPRDACIHALLPLERVRLSQPAADTLVRPLMPDDWEPLARTFASAFRGVPPFETLDDDTAASALRESLDATQRGEDGPLVEAACFVAEADRAGAGLSGGLLTTLLPGVDPGTWDAWRWKAPPPPDCVERRLGRPHVTWVFVQPFDRRRGVAGALLGAVAARLRGLGYGELTSTVLAGNLPSVVWHWQQGFQLVSPWRHRAGSRE